MATTYRVLWSPEMSSAEQQAFQRWATEEFEWNYRLAEAKDRVRDAEKKAKLESHVRSLRAFSQASVSSRSCEDVTVAEGSQKGKAA